MKNTIRQLSHSLLITSALLLSGCSDPYPSEYSAAPLSARIVDSETGDPVEGAIVVAVYVMESLGGRVYTPLHYEETLTDKKGDFTFNGFDKKSVSKEMTGAMAPLGNRDPRLYAFAEGYVPAMYQRKYIFSKVWKTSHRISPLDGRTFTLNPNKNASLNMQSEELSSIVSHLSTDINTMANPGTGKRVMCAFNAIPMTLEYIQMQLEHYANSGKKYFGFTVQQATVCFEKGIRNEN